MKKLFFLTTALALVIGLSQCTKTRPDMPHYSGPVGDMYVQHVNVNASHGSSNSKVSGSQSGTALDLVWDKGDVIYVYDQTIKVQLTNTLKLKGDGGDAEGQFEGDITATTGDELTFYYKGSNAVVEFNEGAVTYAASNFIGQDGTLDGADGIFKRLLIMKKDVKFPLDGSTLELSVPYAILYLDLSIFGSTSRADDGATVTVKVDDNTIATIKNVKSTSTGMYVALPTDNSGTEKIYEFSSDNGKTLSFKWTLDSHTFFTAAGTQGGSIKPVETDEWIDFNSPAIGITGMKIWAKYNVGANVDKILNDSEHAVATDWYGKYYAWGETKAYGEIPAPYDESWTGSTNSGYLGLISGNTPKTTYTYYYYKWGTATDIYKYTSTSVPLGDEDNVAKVESSNFWDMPTKDDWAALIANTYCVWTSNYAGISGLEGFAIFKVKSTLDKGSRVVPAPSNLPYSTESDPHLFLPVSGLQYTSGPYDIGSCGYYWSKNVASNNKANGSFFACYEGGFQDGSLNRCCGLTIRPVR